MYSVGSCIIFIDNKSPTSPQLLPFRISTPKPATFLTFYTFIHCLHPCSPFYWPYDTRKFISPRLCSLLYKMEFLSYLLQRIVVNSKQDDEKTPRSFQLQISLALKTCSKAHILKNTSKQRDWRKGECVSLLNLS